MMVQRRRNRKWIGWLLFLGLIIAAVVVGILVKNNLFDKQENNKTSETVVNNGESQKEETKPIENEEETEKDIPQYDGESPNEATSLSGVVSYADVSGEDLIIRVNIDQFLATGSCNLKVTENGRDIYSEEVGIEASVTTSTCAGFKIPVSKLSNGDLQIEIELNSDGKKGIITGKVRI